MSEPLSDRYLHACRVLLEADGVDPIEWAERAPALVAEIERLRVALEIVEPPSPPTETFTAPEGPPARCEVCCAPIAPGSAVASWVDGERQVVAHAGPCPGTLAPQVIDVATKDGPVSVSAFVCGMWAAHEMLLTIADPDRWVVTHLPTGHAARFRDGVSGASLPRDTALLLAEMLGTRCSSEPFRDPMSPASRRGIAAVARAVLGRTAS